MRESFRLTGMTHIIAISGFNISIVAAALLTLLKPVLGRRLSVWPAMVGVALYAILVGGDASVVRAAIMGGIYLLSNRVAGRPSFGIATLLSAGVLMSIFDPSIPWDIGFQLSFAATLGLMLYAEPLNNRARHLLAIWLTQEQAQRLMGWVSEGILLTIAAQITTIPLMAFHFEQVSLVSLLANPLAIPVQPYVMLAGGLATLTGMVWLRLGQLVAWLAWPALAYTIRVVDVLAEVQLASLPWRLSLVGVVTLYGIMLVVTLFRRQSAERRQQFWDRLRANWRWAWAWGASIILVFLLFAWIRAQPDDRLHLHVLANGGHSASLLQTPSGRHVLIDTGSNAVLLLDQLGRRLPFWKRQLDLIILTHPDRQVAGALPELLDSYDVAQLLYAGEPGTLPEVLIPYAGLANPGQLAPLQVGQRIVVGDGVALQVLVAQAEHGAALQLTHGALTARLDGSLTAGGEDALLKFASPAPTTLFLGSQWPDLRVNDNRLLQALQPQFIVANSDTLRRPALREEMLDRLDQQDSYLLDIAELGSIELISDGEQMWWLEWRER